ncbi:MAG: DNA-processing protein DprA [Rhodospirillales bacterium]
MDGLFFFKRSETRDIETIAALRLARSHGIGPMLWRKLVSRFGSTQAALEAWPDLPWDRGRKAPTLCSARQAEAELERLDRLGAKLLVLGSADYPAAMAEIADPPPVLAVRGNVAALGQAPVAIVGARNASSNGRRLAENFAQALAGAGRVVVSGLARGIDTAAHYGALAASHDGTVTGALTVAVLAGGLDKPYPPENLDLLEHIVERGAAISEVALGTAPTARHFPRRNRIIAGLAQGVVVIEAALKSGSLITARLANEQGREVMAVPGSPLDARCRGCNALLRDGATLIETADDIISALPVVIPPAAPRPVVSQRLAMVPAVEPAAKPVRAAAVIGAAVPVGNGHEAIAGLLAASPTAIDELVRRSALPAATVSAILLDLELAGRLERHAGNAVSLTH